MHNCFSCGFKGTFLDLVMYVKFPHDVFRAARWMRQFGVNLARTSDLTGRMEWLEKIEVVPQTMVPETRLAMFDEVPDWALEKRDLTRESVDHYGVRWDLKHQSWIIPVRTPTGELAGWQEKWQKRRRFMNEPKDMLKSLCLFGFDVFPLAEPAVLLESPLDVLRLYSAGWEGGVSSYGAAVSLAQMQLIEVITDEIVVALDNDKDGRLHAEELRDGRWERGKRVRRPFANGNHVRFFDYGTHPAKDIGDMEQGAIERGLYEAQHSSVARLGTDEQKRQRRGFHRNTPALPGATSRANGRPRAVPADGRRGMPDGRHRGGRQQTR
jgi:hypothetical protein